MVRGSVTLSHPHLNPLPSHGGKIRISPLWKRGARGDFRVTHRFTAPKKIPLNPPFSKGGNSCLHHFLTATPSLEGEE